MKRKFSPGCVVTTPAAMNALHPADVYVSLARHTVGDWGDVDEESWAANDVSLEEGARLVSAYSSNGTKFWIITEADRSATTVLLPEEY